MLNNAAVVIPVYKENLNEFEKISLAQVQKVLGNYQIIFVAPRGKNFSYFTQGSKIYFFQPQFFQSDKTYSELMKSPIFYKSFLEYKYILIYQLDAFVFSDELEYFCGLGYDYIGASWYPLRKIILNNKIYKVCVGNGGFSLRKVQKIYNLLMNHNNLVAALQGLPEDNFFSLCGILYPNEFVVAPQKIAHKFSIEVIPERFVKKNGGKLPFGCHDWYDSDADFFIKTFLKFGYDLRPLQKNMDSKSKPFVKEYLINFALKRLQRRLQRGQSLMKYLPNKNFASVRVVRSPLAMMILARLILENNQISDEIILYDEDEQDILIQDLKSARTPHLIVRGGGDALIDELAKRGVTYGKRVVSFNKEYLSYCEKLFHNLGK